MTLLMVLAIAVAVAWVARPEGATAYELGGLEHDARVLTTEGTQTTDTQWYADHYGVTLDEATRRLALGSEISTLQSKLRRDESESFAGLWIEHTPEYKVVVRFTANGNETIQPYVQNGPLSQMVEARMADLSEAALIESQHTAVSLADELGIDKDSSVDIRNNRVELNVVDQADLQSKLDSRGLSLPTWSFSGRGRVSLESDSRYFRREDTHLPRESAQGNAPADSR